MDYKLLAFLIILTLLIILILFILYKNRLTVDSFTNKFSKDNCCNQNEIAQCETYGKTGVCNYYKNNNSCMCQNSF
jgi:hypothetical protein